MFNMESMHLLNLSVQNALEHIAENFNLKNFLGGACARNSLEKCAVRSPDGRYRAHIATLYYISLVYPFLPVRDISISGYRYRALWLVKIKTETKQIWPRATGDASGKWNKFLNSECIKNTTVESTFGRSFPELQRRRPSFCCFTCSSDVPLQVTCGLMA